MDGYYCSPAVFVSFSLSISRLIHCGGIEEMFEWRYFSRGVQSNGSGFLERSGAVR